MPEQKYEVYHPDAEGPLPTFDTWQEAFEKQTEWNKDCPGHRARKITVEIQEDMPE